MTDGLSTLENLFANDADPSHRNEDSHNYDVLNLERKIFHADEHIQVSFAYEWEFRDHFHPMLFLCPLSIA